ncbi:MAG: TonB-dependent receptor domain-containing protein [Bryobacteraceae bacterium]
MAQSADTASVQGTVADSQGAVMPQVTVKATNTQTGFVRSDVSSATGAYRLRALPPGSYELSAEASGFQTTVRKGIILTVGQEAVIDFTLAVAGVQTQVVVEANAPIVDTVSPTTGANLVGNQLQMLPTISRNYTDFLRIISGALSTSNGVSMLGARGESNNWQIDGVDNTADSSGQQRLAPQLDAISEFQVLTHSFKAEYGHAAGAVVTAISKSGTNSFHGSAYMFYRDENFRAYSPFENTSQPKAPFKRMYNGGTFGGPIKKNRLFFFLAYQRLYQDQNTQATWALPDTVPAFSEKTLSFFRMYNVDPNQFTGGRRLFITAQPLTSHQPSGRLDLDLGRGHSISTRYQFYQSKQTTNKTGTLFDLTGTTAWNRSNDININHKWVMSSARVNEFYVLYTRDLNGYLNDYPMPILNVTSANMALGGSTNYPQSMVGNRLQVKDHFIWVRGKHEVKAGGEMKLSPFTAVVANLFQGMYVFPYLTNPAPSPVIPSLVNGIPAALVQQVGDPAIPLHNSLFGWFVQDDWRVLPKLTLSFGVRYDYQISKIPALLANPGSYNYYGVLPMNGAEDPAISRDKNNFAPRFGFAWAPTPSQTIYGGTGIFYDQVIINNFVSALFTPPYRAIYQISSPPFPQPVTSFGTLAAPNIGFLDPSFRAPWAWNSALGYRREITPNMGLDVSVVVNRGFSQQMSMNMNTGRTGSGKLDGTGYVRLNPNVGGVNRYFNGGGNRYEAFRAELKRRMSRRISGGIAYTLAWSKDNSFTKITTIQVPTAPWLNWGPSNYDIRHNLVSHVETELPLGFQFAAILEARTAMPLDVTTGAYDLNGDGVTNDWVNQAICVNIACQGFQYSRNSVRQLSTAEANRLRSLFNLAPITAFARNPNFWNTDISLRKQINIREGHSVTLILEAFNAFNIEQYRQPVASISNNLFGQWTSVTQPRTMQLGIHYRF